MSKTKLKEKITEIQNGECALSGVMLNGDQSLNDTDRRRRKCKGGIYTLPNTRVVNPVAHMERHGILRTRTPMLDKLKSVFDDRQHVIRYILRIDNQLRATKRETDTLTPETRSALEESRKPAEVRRKSVDSEFKKLVREYAKVDPLTEAVLAIKGAGEITAGSLAVYVDLEKASTPSALWKYTGLHTASHRRYTKGDASGGNKTLRTVLYTTAESMMKNKQSAYRDVYDRVKTRLSHSENKVISRNTQGKLVEVEWSKTKPSHRHGAALRAIIKQFLCDYWITGRTLAGLPVTTPYVQGVLGHQDIIPASARGWPTD